MGLLDIVTANTSIPPLQEQKNEGGNIITTTVDAVVNWGRKRSGPSCRNRPCANNYGVYGPTMTSPGSVPVLRFSPRQADLLLVAGTVVDKMGPIPRR
jgi:NADH-quinone oxidoreductase subunit B